jgi:hypothetical protein
MRLGSYTSISYGVSNMRDIFIPDAPRIHIAACSRDREPDLEALRARIKA